MENIKIFTELTGLLKLPANRQYWTLANKQTDEPTSEINQLVDAGFLTKRQFNGVDNCRMITARNRKAHPSAEWHPYDWADAISRTSNFNPALVYLDSIHEADSAAALRLIAATMSLMPAGSVLLFNAVDKSPYRKARVIDPGALASLLKFHVALSELRRWRVSIPSFTYTGRRAGMRTYAFYKES